MKLHYGFLFFDYLFKFILQLTNRFKIENYQQAYMLVFEYINTFYNTVRIHSHCNYMSPNDYEKLYANYKKKAALIAG